MKKQFYSFIIALLLGTAANAQFTAADIQYWLGTGTDTTILVIDFQDGSWDQSYAWGYLHNSNATAQEMLEAIAAADVNLEISVPGGFISDITYGSHEGIGGTLIEEVAHYWSTWSGTASDNFVMNGGASEQLTNGSWFGCSFTDFDPAIEPTTPLAAFEPFRFTAEDVEFWVGTGDDETIVVIDFQTTTGTASYAWGYRHTGETSGEDILNAIDAADDDLELTIDGGFLMDITYNGLEGLYNAPNYWSTWSATNLGNWYTNMGVGELYSDGDILGCSYTDFMPALRPRYPLAAPAPLEEFFFSSDDVDFWVGTGTDSTLLIIDFQTGTGTSSFVWGYLHNGAVTGETILNDVTAADPSLNVVIASEFLNDITYNDFSGLGGNPNYWSTWSATNPGVWEMNNGISTTFGNGDIFGCSYTDFNPALAPGYPVAASIPTKVESIVAAKFIEVYPNPSSDILNVNITANGAQTLRLYDIAGVLVFEKQNTSGIERIDVSTLPSGMYILQAGNMQKKVTVQ